MTCLQVLNTNYLIDEKDNYFMRTMTASILDQMGTIFEMNLENIVLSYQSTCLHIIALACQ